MQNFESKLFPGSVINFNLKIVCDLLQLDGQPTVTDAKQRQPVLQQVDSYLRNMNYYNRVVL